MHVEMRNYSRIVVGRPERKNYLEDPCLDWRCALNKESIQLCGTGSRYVPVACHS
jgi:hypothetical protein